MIPCVIPRNAVITRINISAELSSEAPGSNAEWPSDLHFFLGDVLLGVWTSPGDFGRTPGIYTPSWWDPNWNQYGLLKFLSVNDTGTFIDGVRVSDVSLKDLNISAGSGIMLKLSVGPDSVHQGGLTLYGRSFGNYPQDIIVRMQYKVEDGE